jgi:hypothetical protein
MHKRPLLAWLGWSYILLITVWLVLRLLFFDQLWWLALVNTVAEYLFLPLPVLLLASLWRRSWRLLLGLCLPAIAFGALFGALFLPRPNARPVERTPDITVMTFNVLTTYSRRPPFLAQRLDYIWHSSKLVALDAMVGPAGGSDHLPVLARLALQP